MEYLESGLIWTGHDAEMPVARNHRALRILDDSMEPRFPRNTILVVDPDAEPGTGSFVLACIKRSQDMFGQLAVEGGKTYIKPVNPRYPAVLLDHDCAIGGVVKQAIFEIEQMHG